MKKTPALTTEPVSSAGLHRFYYLTAAGCGAAIMVIEILGAKMLAPYVGTSHFVWTAQITVTLVALAAGYYAGGWLADRSRKPTRLYTAILIAALYLAGIVLCIRPVAYACLSLKLALGSLLASAVLFFIPLALLAMTAPFLIRSLTASLNAVGGSVGRLTAISTLGSVAGTLLIGYFLLPLLANSTTLLGTAGVLAALSTAYFLIWHRTRGTPTALVLALLLGGGLAFASVVADRRSDLGEATELYRRNSDFGLLQVVEPRDSQLRYYLNDYLVQNTYDPASKRGVSTFTYLLHGLAQAYTPNIRSALCIGLGIGLVPREFAEAGVSVDVVEINPAVPEVARDFFDCPIEQLKLHIGDGRQFLNATTNRYDAVILDAFLGDSSPVHLFSREAFEAVRRVLRPDGVLVINCFADFRARRDFFGASLDKTLRSVFRSVKIHGTGSGNVYFVASGGETLEIRRTPDFERVHPAVRWQAQAAFGGILYTDARHGMVLTDDFNPTEFFDAPNREETRRSLARSIRSL